MNIHVECARYQTLSNLLPQLVMIHSYIATSLLENWMTHEYYEFYFHHIVEWGFLWGKENVFG